MRIFQGSPFCFAICARLGRMLSVPGGALHPVLKHIPEFPLKNCIGVVSVSDLRKEPFVGGQPCSDTRHSVASP